MNKPQLSRPYQIRQPVAATDGQSPLLVLAHGYGSNEDDLFGLADYLDDRFTVVSVRAPITLGPGAYAWYPLQFTPEGLGYEPREAESGWTALNAFVDEVVSAFDIDRERIFLAGFSQGGIMSLSVALLHPEKVAGVVVMSGLLLPEAREKAAVETLNGLPVLVTHGKWDDVIPVERGREIGQALADLPLETVYREYPMAHQVSAESLADIDDWLRAHLDGTSQKDTAE
jgi:phospholipase/carboxylesterase